MLDYWISFTVSMTPNDGRGLFSACCLSLFAQQKGHTGGSQGQYGPSTNPTVRYVRV